jgi:3-hydroxyacyl-CoA dehydrogenase
MTVVRYKVEQGIAWLAMNNPPLNALSHALRSGIVAALDRALSDAKVRAVVLIGNERAFSSGADIKEFAGGAFYADPFLPAVVDIVEGASKPVIAAISCACMGGGLELALGCHYRIARADAKIAFPEVKLGLIPGAGGTQRFPRLVGLEAALNMIASGATVPASTFKGTGLFDAITADSLQSATREFTLKLIKDAKPIRRVRDLPCEHQQDEAFLQFAKTAVAAVSRGLAAPARVIEAVGASVKQKFDAGIAIEQKVFSELMLSGGNGKDVFTYALSADEGHDLILDFKTGNGGDSLEIADLIDVNGDNVIDLADLDAGGHSVSGSADAIVIAFESGTSITLDGLNGIGIDSFADLVANAKVNVDIL